MMPRGAGVTVGRIHGFRGRSGAVTVRVISGDAARWTRLRSVALPEDGAGDGLPIEVEEARAYRDRLVLKLHGIDDATAAARLRGRTVVAPGDEVPELPSGVYWVERLLGARVVDADGAALGEVEDVMETGGTDVLVVRRGDGGELLVPLAAAIVTAIDLDAGTIRVDLPDGLETVNAGDGADGTKRP